LPELSNVPVYSPATVLGRNSVSTPFPAWKI
jgi:hypothetical protein